MSVVWVRPDVPGISRVFTYALPASLAESLPVGTIVRIPLQGRRVRGWVVPSAGIEPETELREVLEVASAGPPTDVVALADWTAWRYAGNPTALLRVASPPNRVRELPRDERSRAISGANPSIRIVALPPAADRLPFIRSMLASLGSTIVVLPSGTRARRLANLLEADRIAAVVLSGSQSDAERTAAWRRARAGSCVVVGGRVAAFAPVPDLAAMVVLDEGDAALTEERAPTWNAREVAIERSRRAGIPIALVSPAPSLEARMLASNVERPERSAERDGWPRVEVVDRRHEEHRVGVLSVPFAAAAHVALDAGARVVAVVNRRGRVRLYVCATCHEIARCEHCAGAMHEAGEGLECPRCGSSRPRICALCYGTKLVVARSGVTRLADDLRALLPQTSVADVDAATDVVPGADVFIGTEAVLHRVPRDRPIDLVAFLDFDQELLAPRVRAADQAQWLLIRAARLVGARHRGGRILVQTSIPDHPVVVAAQTADPLLVADRDRLAREALGFPPFGGLAAIRGEREPVDLLIASAEAAAATVIGPTRVGSSSTALIRMDNPAVLADLLDRAGSEARGAGRIRIDVDPERT